VCFGISIFLEQKQNLTLKALQQTLFLTLDVSLSTPTHSSRCPSTPSPQGKSLDLSFENNGVCWSDFFDYQKELGTTTSFDRLFLIGHRE